MEELDPVVVLRAIEDIRVLKARYFRLLDSKQWDELVELFVPDATIDVRDDSGTVIEGAGRFVEGVRAVLADVETVHQGGMPEIEITSATTATGIWAMQDHLRWPATDEGTRELHGFGHYIETYQRDDSGAWRIASMRLTRLRRDMTME